MPPKLESTKIESLPVGELNFDRQNPRLVGYGIRPSTPDEEVIKTLWQEMAVDEVAMSIVASGYWQQEPLIVTKEGGKWVVIEGNRRLAAIRALLEPKLAQAVGTELTSQLKPEAKATLDNLPVIKSTREESWRYLGFRHVNGPARWSSYAKAEYIRFVHEKYKIPLEEIASQIGDRHRTVRRLYRALMVLQQASRAKVYSLDDRTKKNLPFSHLYTALDYEGFQDFLKLKSEEDETESPVPTKREPQLGQVLVWLFGNKKDGKPAVVEKQNPDVRRLDKVLRSEESRRALERGTSLYDAFVLADPAKDRLRAHLLDAKSKLQAALGVVSEGFDGEEDIVKTSGTVATLAEKVYNELENKYQTAQTGGKKGRMTDGTV
jgi:hypothetical protein